MKSTAENIGHVISSIDVSTGGPAQCLADLLCGILNAGENFSISLFTAETLDPILKSFENSNGSIHFLKNTANYAAELSTEKHALLHGHGLWEMPVHQMAKFAGKNKIPYIITVHGMLDMWSLNHKKWKKKIALVLFQSRDLRKAAVLHATSQVESENIRNAGFKNPIAVIPNGVEVKPLRKVRSQKVKTALFLSRLVMNKGIEELLHSWSELKEQTSGKWQLQVVGEGSAEYTEYLIELKSRLGLDNVIFSGPKYGSEKEDIFAKADLFVLPTYTENFGVAIAEAMAAAIPVITTVGAPWKELSSSNAGWHIEIGQEPLTIALKEALTASDETLTEMGANGRKIIEEKYSADAVAEKMTGLYKWVLAKGDKPDFVTQ